MTPVKGKENSHEQDGIHNNIAQNQVINELVKKVTNFITSCRDTVVYGNDHSFGSSSN